MPSLLRRWISGGAPDCSQQQSDPNIETEPHIIDHGHAHDQSSYGRSTYLSHEAINRHNTTTTSSEHQRTSSDTSSATLCTVSPQEQWENIDDLVAEVGRLHQEVTLLRWQTKDFGTDPDESCERSDRLQKDHVAMYERTSNVMQPAQHHRTGSAPNPALAAPFVPQIVATTSPVPSNQDLCESNEMSWAKKASVGIQRVVSGAGEDLHGPTLQIGTARTIKTALSRVERNTDLSNSGWEIGAWTRDQEDSATTKETRPTDTRITCMSPDTVIVEKDIPSSSNGKAEKRSPHFAQSTQAATRRVDQTLRKTNTATGKGSPEAPSISPTMNKMQDLGTEKRVKHPRRSALPHAWAPHCREPSSKTSPSMARQPGSSPEDCSVGQSVQGSTGVTSDEEMSPVSCTEDPDSSPHKTTASYMFPTKATQRRNQATLELQHSQRRRHRPNADTHNQTLMKESTTPSPKSPHGFMEDDSQSTTPCVKIAKSSTAKTHFGADPSSAIKMAAIADAAAGFGASTIPLPSPPTAFRSVLPTTVQQVRDPAHDFLEPIRDNLRRLNLWKGIANQDQPLVSSDMATGSKAGRNKTKSFEIVTSIPRRVPNSLKSAVVSPIRKQRTSPYTVVNDSRGTTARPHGLAESTNRPVATSPLGLRGRSSPTIGRALTKSSSLVTKVPTELASRMSQVALQTTEQQAADQGDVQDTRSTECVESTKSLEVSSGSQTPHTVDPASETPIPASVGREDIVIDTSTTRTAHDRSTTGHASMPYSLRATASVFTPRHIGPALETEPVTPDQNSVFPYKQFSASPEHCDQSSRHMMYNMPYDDWMQPGVTINTLWAQHSNAWSQGLTDEPKATINSDHPVLWAVSDDNDCGQQRVGMSPVLTISPHSTDTSSPMSDVVQNGASPTSNGSASRHAYTISARSGRHSWRGGDGLELSFRGYGPEAERDPSAPVTLTSPAGSRNRGSNDEDRRWPRWGSPSHSSRWDDMTAYAWNKGYPKVPCDRRIVTRRAEVAGKGWRSFCNGCLDRSEWRQQMR